MIYMVACRFIQAEDTERLAQWNAYYDGPKLDTLLSLDGFTGSQRFRCVHSVPAPYVALHSITGPEVMDARYRNAGGGTFESFQGAVDNWTRDLFTGLDEAPEVGDGAYLALTDDEATASALTGIDFVWLDSAGLDRSVNRLALAILDQEDGEELAEFRPGALRLYTPITPLRKEPTGTA